jgi:hypothetical protein
MISANFFKEDEGNYRTRRKSWDRFNAFHVVNGVFVEFESGELMITDTPNPDNRNFYPEYNVQLVTTSDADCPTLYLDKECTLPAKKAWLNHKGQQHLAIDYEQKVAFALSELWTTPVNVALGNHVSNARAYWSGQKRLPVPIEKIKVQTPDPAYKKKMLSVLTEVRVAVTAIHRMSPPDKRLGWWVASYLAKQTWHDSSAGDIIAELSDDPQAMYNVATNGFEYPRSTNAVDFLYVKERN